MLLYIKRKSNQFKTRRGVAAVETAVLLPALVFITFGAIELSNMVFIRQGLAIAGYEGAKLVTIPGASEGPARTRITEILSARGINNPVITFTPSVTTGTARGTMITVTVSAPQTTGVFLPVNVSSPRMFQNQTAMVRQ